jgi:cephalosporin hydroxylase
MNWSEQSFTGFGQLFIVKTVGSDIKHHNPSAIFQLYRGPSIDVSYQVSVHLAEGVSEEKIKM